MKQLLIPLALLIASPVYAGDYTVHGGTRQTTCYETVYLEEYVPGTAERPGYVRSYSEEVATDCGTSEPPFYDEVVREDNNDCRQGAVLGGIAGAALGAGLSRDEGNLIGIPLGIVGGAIVGCQLDGG